jgi:uncharacterized membrane protein SpoIIM required for sporulation
MSDFVSRNKADWQELERLLARGHKAIGKMTPGELARLDVLYRRVSIHLAQVATRSRDAKLLRYLNDLAAAAHVLIYLPSRQPLLKGAALFVVEGFARSVARTWKYQAVSAACLVLGAVVAYFASMHDVLAAYALSMPGDPRTPGSTPDQLREVLHSGREQGGATKFAFASFLFTHNLKVGILSMGLGVLAAVPTVILIFYNGMILGAFIAMHHRAGIYGEVWAWLLPHGVTELGAIVLCGGIGLMLGMAVLSPGEMTRTEALRRAGIEAGRIVIGVAAMLVMAAIIESYLRQSHLSTAARLAFAAGTALFWAAYFANGAIAERKVVSTLRGPATRDLLLATR